MLLDKDATDVNPSLWELKIQTEKQAWFRKKNHFFEILTFSKILTFLKISFFEFHIFEILIFSKFPLCQILTFQNSHFEKS